MMRLVALLFVLAAAAFAAPTPAHCVWCPTFVCYGSCGFQGCTCLVPPGSPGGGSCFGTGHAERLLAEGWRALE